MLTVFSVACWFAAGVLVADATATLVGVLRHRRKPRRGV